MSKTKQDMRIELIQVGFLQANDWNPNVMQQEEYEALKQDMHIHGVNGIDPILVSPAAFFHSVKDEGLKNYFVIVDGEHRWRAAAQLAWKEIRCEIRDITEEDTKALCYRRNRERGTIDPFKEALLFKSEGQITQAKIAGKYGIKQGTVSQRLSLLKLDSAVVETLKDIPRGIITVSHLEPLTTLTPEDQVLVTKQLIEGVRNYGHPDSVKRIQEHTERIKKERLDEATLTKALETAKYPKCPVCRQKPEGVDYAGLPWVRCRSWHEWNIDTGKRRYEPISESQNTLDGESKPLQPKTLRSAHTVQEVSKVFIDLIKNLIGTDATLRIEKIDVSGMLQNSQFSFDVNTYGKSMSVSWHHGSVWQGFRAEEHDYRTGEKSAITTGSPDDIEYVKELIENAFNGKLGFESKRLKKSKSPAEVIHELHSSPLEAEEDSS